MKFPNLDLTPTRLNRIAEDIVRARLRKRSRTSIVPSGYASDDEACSSKFASAANALASIVGIEADYLRPDDRLGNIFRVDEQELPDDVRPVLRKFLSGDRIVVFGFEILALLERRIAMERSILERPLLLPAPKSEDEWMERLLGMTVEELLSVLA
jgi:hypothetical protein